MIRSVRFSEDQFPAWATGPTEAEEPGMAMDKVLHAGRLVTGTNLGTQTSHDCVAAAAAGVTTTIHKEREAFPEETTDGDEVIEGAALSAR